MGRFFQLPYVKEDTMAKKVVKRQGGLETPRNSLELPVEPFYGLYAGKDNKMYSCHSMKESSRKKSCSTEAPIKKLISEEISKRSNARANTPSIVARLMGVDMLPVDSGQESKMVGRKNGSPAGKHMVKEHTRKGSDAHDSFMWDSSPQQDLDFVQDFDSYSDRCSSHIKMSQPKRREHPQEEELQKFKKEFEAWQAARFMECSKVVEFSNSPSQSIAQDELNRETKFCYNNSKRRKSFDNLKEPNDLPVRPYETFTARNCGKKGDYLLDGYLLDGVKESFYSNRMSKTKIDIQPTNLMNSDVSAPTKIVILRPGPDRMGVSQDSWNSTPSTFEERGSIQDFLEEVKERLKSELQGKSPKKSTTVRGGGIETPYREKPSESKQIAQRIAQQVRDSVTEDFGMNLLRSESTRSYRSDIQLNGTDSPEFVNRETRKLLTERLRNALKGETNREVPMFSHRRLGSSVLDHEKSKARHSRDASIKNKMGCSERSMNDSESLSRSFRESSDDCRMHYKEPSPGNLVRSLSAPVSGSGTSFGKLLLEDRHIFTGAQIRMKHEVVENVSMDVKKQKDKFKIREKVSSFGYSLTLRGRLFRRRVQSVDELHYHSDDLLKDIASGPTVMMSSYETHENSTEVPPSPASVCSSVCDELWRPAVLSSPASSGASQLDDSELPDVFNQINSNLNDLRKKLDQLESPGLEESITEEKSHEVEKEIEDPTEAYVRELLVASGYYDSSCNRYLSKWDAVGKPISNQVFEEVEESYRQSTKVDENSTKDQGAKINNRLIFDLLNEALLTALRQPANISRARKAIIESVHCRPPHGRELLSLVWEIIRSYVHHPADRSCYVLDSMLAQDLKSDLWSGLLDDDINGLGKDLECQITGDLIEELVKDIFLLLT